MPVIIPFEIAALAGGSLFAAGAGVGALTLYFCSKFDNIEALSIHLLTSFIVLH